MGGFSQATLERIRAASDIVDIIGAALPLKRAGANFTALCPFHKEKTPSFNVNPQKQIFHCFGCHKGGDVFTFVKEYENIGFVDAVRRLADRAKIPLEIDQNPAEQQSRHLKDELLQIHEQITQRWQSALANEAGGQLARDYLAKRGVSAEAIKLFRLGVAPDAWDDTVNWAKSKNHELPLVEKAGLIIRKEETGNYYDRFRGRLMFPICDEQGRVIGFSGRILSGDEKTAKYVNSPETPIFTKSKVFFGLDKSKRALLDAQSAIICEGQLDLIACFMGGVQNVVAPQGTAFTDQHARIIKRYVDEVVLCFDSDEAGQNAAVRSLDHLLASGLAVRVAVVPAPHDPDSFIKANGGEAFRKLADSAETFFDYYLNHLCTQYDVNSDKGRLQVLRLMLEALQKTGNVAVFDKYAKSVAPRLGFTLHSVVTEFRKLLEQQSIGKKTEIEPVQEIISKPSPHEFHLLKLLLLHDDLVAQAALHLDVNWISHLLIRQIIQQRLSAQKNETWKSLAAFLDECDLPEMKSLITEAVAEERKIPNLEQQLSDVILKLRNQFLDRQITALAQKASQPETGEGERLKMLLHQQEFRQLKRQPLATEHPTTNMEQPMSCSPD
jgi:DNA primase